MPLEGMSLPAVDTLAVGPGSLMEREIAKKKDKKKDNCKQATALGLCTTVTKGEMILDDNICSLTDQVSPGLYNFLLGQGTYLLSHHIF